MRCIFCKSDSSSSRSVEHIIPESLGNTEHVLPPGVVCDSCNNYFGGKIEQPLLASGFFTQVRARNNVANKKGRFPPVEGIHLQSGTQVNLERDKDNSLSLYPVHDRDGAILIQNILNSTRGTIIIPIETEPNRLQFSRFLGKVAIEVLAERLCHLPGGLDEIVDKTELDPLRYYARRGNSNVWPFHMRRIYPEDCHFFAEDVGYYELLHEYTLLYTDNFELFLVLALFGVEYTINMGEPHISGYLDWLQKNGGRSPLYS
jgi:hypothetical protein